MCHTATCGKEKAQRHALDPSSTKTAGVSKGRAQADMWSSPSESGKEWGRGMGWQRGPLSISYHLSSVSSGPQAKAGKT